MIKLCNQAYEEVKMLLEQRKAEVAKLANILLQKETVELDELSTILGKREVATKGNLDSYIQDLKEKKKVISENNNKEAPKPSAAL